MMKKSLIIVVTLILIGVMNFECKADAKKIEVNSENFPSESLRMYILKEVDNDKDGLLSEDERLAVKNVGINNISDEEDDSIDNKSEYEKLSVEEKYQRYKVINLKGLEMFPNIEEINLVVGDKLVNLKTINKLTKIKKITLGNVHHKINYSFSKLNNLNSLKLSEIECTNLTIKNNKRLSYVDLYAVTGNEIVINNNKVKHVKAEFLNIKKFQCNNNKSLKDIELSGDTSDGTYKKADRIKKMSFHNNSKLKKIDIFFFKKLKKIDMVKNKKLKLLELNLTPSLKKIFLKKNKSSARVKVKKYGQKIKVYKNK